MHNRNYVGTISLSLSYSTKLAGLRRIYTARYLQIDTVRSPRSRQERRPGTSLDGVDLLRHATVLCGPLHLYSQGGSELM